MSDTSTLSLYANLPVILNSQPETSFPPSVSQVKFGSKAKQNIVRLKIQKSY